jgi:hypothetical protein
MFRGCGQIIKIKQALQQAATVLTFLGFWGVVNEARRRLAILSEE